MITGDLLLLCELYQKDFTVIVSQTWQRRDDKVKDLSLV